MARCYPREIGGVMASAAAKRFFYENAGSSHNPATETAEEGRLRGAEALARAEEWLKSGPYYVDVVPDPEPWDADVPWDGPVWVVDLYSVADTAAPERLASLGGVGCEEGDPYLRVVAAELALEHIEEAS